MAVVSGSNITVWGHTTVAGPAKDSSGNIVFGCYVAAYFTGTYAQADNAQILAVQTAIADSLRNDRTVTLRSACFARPGLEAGVAMGANTVAVSTNDLTMQLTGADLTTEHAGATLGSMTEPVTFYVTYVTPTV